MAEENTEEQDPSIEEILDSIRQIISDDDEEAGEDSPAEQAAPEPEAPVEPEPAPEEAEEPEDVIELTDKIEDETPEEAEPTPEPAPEEPEPEPEPIEVDMQESEDPVEEPAPSPEPAPAAPAPIQEDAESLLTNTAETAAYDGFAELAKATAVEAGGVTVEEIVRTELRPLLRDWLDKHLPNMIERLVQEELERVAKRALDE